MTDTIGGQGQSMFLIPGRTGTGRGFCRPLPYHLGTAPLLLRTTFRNRAGASSEHEPVGNKRNLERETGFEPATSTLARSHSTTELLPLRPTIVERR